MCVAGLRPAVSTIPETDLLRFRPYRVVVGVGGGASDNPV